MSKIPKYRVMVKREEGNKTFENVTMAEVNNNGDLLLHTPECQTFATHGYTAGYWEKYSVIGIMNDGNKEE